jgi:hypothetical protein
MNALIALEADTICDASGCTLILVYAATPAFQVYEITNYTITKRITIQGAGTEATPGILFTHRG